jgi:aminopeptidase N
MLCNAAATNAQSAASLYEALAFERVSLAIRVFPDERRIEGEATLTFSARSRTESLHLSLHPNFRISRLQLGAAPVAANDWAREGGDIRIRLPATLAAGAAVQVRVIYAGVPPVAPRPPWQGGMVWSKTEDGVHWIGSSLWGGGCDLLWPCIDHPAQRPARADLRISVPRPLVAPANGVLIDVTERDGWRTYHWRARSPHAYGIVINAGPFALLRADYASRFGNHIPMNYWYLPQHEANARELFAEFPRILGFFESVIGPYPWGDQKMGVVHVPFKGMEHQTINAYGNGYAKSLDGFDALLQHEFSHEYFGNQMTVSNYDDLWLHEGFATYMQMLYAEYLYGEADYYALLKSTRAEIRNERALVAGRERSQAQVYGQVDGPGTDLYFKGSLVLHTLRGLIDDEAFFASVRRLVYDRSDPRPGNFAPQLRTTRDFVRIVSDVTGRDLSWFFDAYLYEAELPILELERTGEELRFTWKRRNDGPFPLPLEVSVDGRMVVLPMTGNRGAVQAREYSHIIVDPRARVLRQSDVIDRYRRRPGA